MEKEKKLLDPKNDLVFHAMFREKNNKLTEAFISSVLKEEVKIVSNLDRHLDISKTVEKFGVMDLNVELADKTKCNIEMQVVEYTGELERFLYYLANSYARQLKKNELYITSYVNILLSIDRDLTTSLKINEIKENINNLEIVKFLICFFVLTIFKYFI